MPARARRDSLPSDTPIVVAARRTPVGEVGSSLAGLSADELAAPVLYALLADLGPRRPTVGEVVLGHCRTPGNLARVAALRAGLGVDVPGVTVDRDSGSGLEAVRLAASLVRSGESVLVLAGGAASASTTPAAPRTRSAPEPYADPDPASAAEALATRLGITRERQDAYAARSHRLARAARDRGAYAREIVPVGGVSEDDRLRGPATTTAQLSGLPPLTGRRGVVTSANSSGSDDGAAAVAVVSERVRSALHIPGLALVGAAVAGVDPQLPGLGPLPALEEALDRAGRSMREIGQVELVETSAAEALACADTWGLDPVAGTTATRLCPDGGALGMGLPLEAAGALLVVRLFASMVREDGPRIGVAACSVRGGQGVALVLERVG